MKVPPLVSKELWDAVQHQLQRNKLLATRNCRREYLLRGLVLCGGCGRHMAGWSRPGYAYYRCGRTSQSKIGTKRCLNGLVRADRLERAVWEAVTRLLRDPQHLRDELHRRRAEGSPTRTDSEGELKIVRGRLRDMPREQDKLIEGYAKGLIPDEKMREWMDASNEERESLESRANELDGRLSRLELSEKQEANAIEFAGQVARGLDRLPFAERQELMQLLVEDITCQGGEVVVRTIIPADGTDKSVSLCSPIREGPGGNHQGVGHAAGGGRR